MIIDFYKGQDNHYFYSCCGAINYCRSLPRKEFQAS